MHTHYIVVRITTAHNTVHCCVVQVQKAGRQRRLTVGVPRPYRGIEILAEASRVEEEKEVLQSLGAHVFNLNQPLIALAHGQVEHGRKHWRPAKRERHITQYSDTVTWRSAQLHPSCSKRDSRQLAS